MKKFIDSKNLLIQVVVFTATCSLALAYISQYLLNVVPCELCFYHRYPLMIIWAVSVLMLAKKSKLSKTLILCSSIVGLGISSYHLGVEQRWWKGPEQCTIGSIPKLDGLSQTEKIAKLRAQLNKKKDFVPCDQVNWRIFGISAVVWSVLMYLFLCVLSWIIYGQKNTQKYFTR